MFKKTSCAIIVFFIAVFYAVPGLSGDTAFQYGLKSSSLYGFPTFVGLKVLQGDSAITVRTGMHYVDVDLPGNDEGLLWWTLGGTFDHYLSDGKLKPYMGGDLDLHFWDFDSTETSVSITPHFGTEYWLSKRFSVSGEAGLTFGFGEFYQNEAHVGTTSSVLVNYYFQDSNQ